MPIFYDRDLVSLDEKFIARCEESREFLFEVSGSSVQFSKMFRHSNLLWVVFQIILINFSELHDNPQPL